MSEKQVARPMLESVAEHELIQGVSLLSVPENRRGGGIATATETVGSTDLLDALNERHYNYSDMLEAYKTGRYHELKYASSDGDQEDFIMWLKRHCASNARGSLKMRGWFEEYRCGCVSDVVKTKRDLLGYCAQHGEDRRAIFPYRKAASSENAGDKLPLP